MSFSRHGHLLIRRTLTGSSFTTTRAAISAAVFFLISAIALAGQSSKPVPLGKAVHNGLAVEFSMEALSSEKNDGGHLREQQDVVFRFAISDATSGTPLRGAYPAAWMDLLPAGQNADARFCSARTKALLDGSVFSKAELDLNAYYVLVLNQDATISVVDPLFGFGNSKLLNLISLAGRGEDWALSSDQQKLFISMPDAGQVAVIDTTTWKVIKNIDVGPRPTRVALQPDQQYLWVAYGESTSTTSGMAVINTAELRTVERIKTGNGAHDLAFSSDSHVAFVTNSASASVSVIDIRSLKKISNLVTADEPVSIAFSTLSQRAYVTHKDGTIAVMDGSQAKVAGKLQSKIGLGQIRFAPGGRWGFVLNPEKNELQILDASSGRVVQSGKMDEGPDQVDFSEKLAYVRHRGSGTVLMVPLDGIGVEGKPLAPADFSGGQNPFGAASRKTPADGIVKAPGANAVLVANPADKSVYYYEEGMAAPKGQFSNYGREALAVLVVDRSLKDRTPGVYETVARLRRPGHYVVPFVMLSPQVVHCFEVTVEPALAPTVAAEQPPRVELLLTGKRTMKTGQPVHLRFRLLDPQTNQPLQNLHDVRVLTARSPGFAQQRQAAVPDGPGIYAIDFNPQQPGTYLAFVECLSRGLTFNNPQGVSLQVEDNGGQQ
jgi:YVTN family beta-propeller protein